MTEVSNNKTTTVHYNRSPPYHQHCWSAWAKNLADYRNALVHFSWCWSQVGEREITCIWTPVSVCLPCLYQVLWPAGEYLYWSNGWLFQTRQSPKPRSNEESSVGWCGSRVYNGKSLQEPFLASWTKALHKVIAEKLFWFNIVLSNFHKAASVWWPCSEVSPCSFVSLSSVSAFYAHSNWFRWGCNHFLFFSSQAACNV